MMSARGVDLSKYNALVTRQLLAQWRLLGYCVGFVNIGIGTIPDPIANYHRDNLLLAGYLTGPYQALHELVSPISQARLLIGSRSPEDRMPNMVDVERLGLSELMVRSFCDTYDSLTDVPLWIYTSRSRWNLIVPRNKERYAKYGLLVADYGYVDLSTDRRRDPPPNIPGLEPLPRVPLPWIDYNAWQFAGDNGRLPGYEHGIDLSIYNMTEEELRAKYDPDSSLESQIRVHLDDMTTLLETA